MEGMKGRTGDESGLVGNPDMFHTLEGVCNYYSLRHAGQQTLAKGLASCISTYFVAHPHLKDGPVFLHPCSSHLWMLVTKLQQVAENGHPRNLGEVLEFGDIGTVEIADHEI